jgi:hypothetical protein
VGKGQHGYFRLYSAEATHIPSDLDGQVLRLDLYPKRRANCWATTSIVDRRRRNGARGLYPSRARADASAAKDRARRARVRLRVSRYSAP